jgi:hypothetical protein
MAWLVHDRGDPPRYLGYAEGGFLFVDDPFAALHFARPFDAVRLVEPGWGYGLHNFSFADRTPDSKSTTNQETNP